MAASTTTVEINKDGWTPVAQDMKFFCAQIKNSGRVLVRLDGVGFTPDDSDLTGLLVGFNLDRLPQTFSAGGLDGNTVCWMRSAGDDRESVVIVSY